MPAYVLIMLLHGAVLNTPFVFRTEDECKDMGTSMLQIVRDTEPGDRSNAMSYLCTSAIIAKSLEGK